MGFVHGEGERERKAAARRQYLLVVRSCLSLSVTEQQKGLLLTEGGQKAAL